MTSNNFEIQSIIREDFSSSRGVARFIHSNEGGKIISQILKREIVKLSPSSLILDFKVYREVGKTSILLEIEKSLETYAENYQDNRLVTSLSSLLRTHIQSSTFEIVGDVPSKDIFPELLSKTLHHFCSQFEQSINLVILLEFYNHSYAEEFLDSIKPVITNLPKNVKIYSFLTNKTLKVDKLHFQLQPDYYWDHPSELGLDIYHLMQMKTPALIDFLTMKETSLLLRLWSLTDIAIPAIEAAINILHDYHPTELALLTQNDELRVGISNQDRYHATYKLYREFAYHLAAVGKIDKAHQFHRKALEIIDQSVISSVEKIKLKAAIWNETARLAKQQKKLPDTIRALEVERSLYNQLPERNALAELSANAYNLGICCRQTRNFEEAIRQLEFSINVEKELGNAENEIESRLELGRVLLDLADNKAAKQQFDLIGQILPKEPHGRSLHVKGINFAYLAYLYKDLGEIEKAQYFAQQAKDIFLGIGTIEDLKTLDMVLND